MTALRSVVVANASFAAGFQENHWYFTQYYAESMDIILSAAGPASGSFSARPTTQATHHYSPETRENWQAIDGFSVLAGLVTLFSQHHHQERHASK